MGLGYQFAFDKAMVDLKAKDPMMVCAYAAVEYSTVSSQYRVRFFDRPFIVDVKTREVFDQLSGVRCPLGTGMLVLHYLTFAQNIETSGKWITLKEVPNGGVNFYPAFKKAVIDNLINAFQNDIAAFDRASASLNGKKIRMADTAAVFTALPKIPLVVLLWQADEEFGGSANFLFDSTIEYFLPIETIIYFGYYLSHKLVQSLPVPNSKKLFDPLWDTDTEVPFL